MSPRIASLLIPLLLLPAAAAGAQPPAAAPYQVVEGIASLAWGDPHPALGGGSPLRLTVAEASGLVRTFYFAPGSPAFDFEPRRLQGRRVRVLFDPARGPGAEPLGVLVAGGDAPDAPALSGSQPWISLMCKFANIAAEPHDLAFFTQMFDNSPGRLDHYWREVSYDIIDVVGSGAYGWVVLPGNQTVYVPTPGSGCLDGDPNNDADLDLLFADCTAVADPFVDFSLGGTTGYVGINLMFNGDLDGCAWGGGMFATLDGISKSWRTTWEPPWGYQNVSVMAHEMGHGFGLPHSNNWDGDSSPYDNSWDVMSDAWNYAASDPTYGTLGKHTIAYHKDLLDWFTTAEVWTPPGNGVYSIVVSDHALPTALGDGEAADPLHHALLDARDARPHRALRRAAARPRRGRPRDLSEPRRGRLVLRRRAAARQLLQRRGHDVDAGRDLPGPDRGTADRGPGGRPDRGRLRADGLVRRADHGPVPRRLRDRRHEPLVGGPAVAQPGPLPAPLRRSPAGGERLRPGAPDILTATFSDIMMPACALP